MNINHQLLWDLFHLFLGKLTNKKIVSSRILNRPKIPFHQILPTPSKKTTFLNNKQMIEQFDTLGLHTKQI